MCAKKKPIFSHMITSGHPMGDISQLPHWYHHLKVTKQKKKLSLLHYREECTLLSGAQSSYCPHFLL